MAKQEDPWSGISKVNLHYANAHIDLEEDRKYTKLLFTGKQCKEGFDLYTERLGTRPATTVTMVPPKMLSAFAVEGLAERTEDVVPRPVILRLPDPIARETMLQVHTGEDPTITNPLPRNPTPPHPAKRQFLSPLLNVSKAKTTKPISAVHLKTTHTISLSPQPQSLALDEEEVHAAMDPGTPLRPLRIVRTTVFS